MMCT